jgi:hypothetical protein
VIYVVLLSLCFVAALVYCLLTKGNCDDIAGEFVISVQSNSSSTTPDLEEQTWKWFEKFMILGRAQYALGQVVDVNFFFHLLEHKKRIVVTKVFNYPSAGDKDSDLLSLIRIEERFGDYPQHEITHLSIASTAGEIEIETTLPILISFVQRVLSTYQGEMVVRTQLLNHLPVEVQQFFIQSFIHCGFQSSLVGLSCICDGSKSTHAQ